jgi:hypothetical protein
MSSIEEKYERREKSMKIHTQKKYSVDIISEGL